MTSTKAIFFAYLGVIVAGLVAFSAIGLARNADDSKPARVVERFAQALAKDDGAGACELLGEDAADAVEKERKKPCEQGVVEMKEDIAVHGAIAATDIAEKSAVVTTDSGESVFLDEMDVGWRIGALGCKRQAGDLPDDCELEG
jgi:hypothetical protein